MKLKNGDTVEHVDDCLGPKQMAGKAGQKKTIGKDIDLYYAKRLLKDGRIKLVNQSPAAGSNPATPSNKK
jgi:hypothetical protein